ncbi:M14 family metallopeptidase [Aquimarina brevivitae]|uniref:Zinc carboxypeptidase n=1 Tax=Aquimarina brevivitae TaxID=323412 RepID=A0A4Q7PJV7_9FLAO|nr:M14 family metallopeptidase [Aquimarina brevivitae]RZT00121.1 zinc carboxypeptidase [Aquimarina brevivitae]
MKKLILVGFAFITLQCAKQTEEVADFNSETTFEKRNGKETATYPEVITYYTQLAQQFNSIDIREVGTTDSGYPLHLITYNPEANFNFDQIHQTKSVILINNGIHPGESDGIDATMMLFRDLANGTIQSPENTVVSTIPVYNIGGALNRNTASRTNQNGPEAYGFRGNARNYDLNRDFIKNDTKNARTFAEIFHLVQPDVFIDNHVSNGADYQYTLTHLFTQHNKLGGTLGAYLHQELQPQLEQSLANKNWDITPYVNVWGTTPDKGWSQFIDYPRYSTGYTSLWNTPGLMVETHMLKPYKQRVLGTYELMKSAIDITEKDGAKIKTLKKKDDAYWRSIKSYPISWAVDTSQTTTLDFKGFEGSYIPSAITGAKRLKYDRNQPYTKKVTYQNYYKATQSVAVPEAYVIPKGWWNIKALLDINKIKYSLVAEDTTLSAEVYHIADYKTRKQPFEGHYLHYNTTITKHKEMVTLQTGDIIVPTAQKGIRYLIETLEPEATDSFFNWNFFDTILQQKEGFSPYVWEDKALSLLQENPELRQEFEEAKKDTAFAKDWYTQLDWIHKKSEHYEKAHLRYPVYRILK